MDTPAPSDNNSVFESFPNYHNFPSQWDLSELETPAMSACDGHGEQVTRMSAKDTPEIETPIPVDDAYPVFSRESFPKLRTFPVYWDLSR
jgi:hypothetical protein